MPDAPCTRSTVAIIQEFFASFCSSCHPLAIPFNGGLLIPRHLARLFWQGRLLYQLAQFPYASVSPPLGLQLFSIAIHHDSSQVIRHTIINGTPGGNTAKSIIPMKVKGKSMMKAKACHFS